MCSDQASQQSEMPPADETKAQEPFRQTLNRHDLKLDRCKTTTLQINVGLLCNQRCEHCHLRAGPDREENMDMATAMAVVSYAARCQFEAIDITGGSPELNPVLDMLIERLSPLSPRIMLRSNLSAITSEKCRHLMELLRSHRVVIVASFPSYNEAQLEGQRGKGIFQRSIAAIQQLNAMGYGEEGSGLELNLVSNPTGAFLPGSQKETEERFRQILGRKWGITFNRLFNFANVPLGRFRDWLQVSGNLEKYLGKLEAAFNPCSVDGLMCRTLVSVSWDGHLYDCDFNLAKGLFLGGRKTHVSEMSEPPEPGTPISIGDHCFTCTAGAGFT